MTKIVTLRGILSAMEDYGLIEVDLKEIFLALRKRIWIIILIGILAVLSTGIVNIFFLDEIYSSSTTLIVSKQASGGDSREMQLSDVNLARNLVDTYSVIIKSNRVLEKVISTLNLNVGIGTLKSNINVSSEGNTEIIRITVEDTIPERAKDIADTLAIVFIDEVKTLLKMDNVQVIDTAKASHTPIRPNVKKNITMALIVGNMVGIGIVLLIELLDNTIKTPEQVQQYLKLPVIGMIPNIGSDKVKR